MRKMWIAMVWTLVVSAGAPARADVEPGSEAIEAFNAYVEAKKADDLKTAEARLKEAVAAQPDWVKARVHLGRLYIDLKEYDGAAAQLQEATRLDSTHAYARHYLGYVYLQQGRYTDAIREIESAQKLDPAVEKEGREFLTKAYLELGNQRKKSGKRSAAVKAYRRAIRLNPDLFVAHYNLGNLYLERQDFAEAEEQFREAVRIKPKNFKAHFNLAIAIHSQGRLEDALAAYETVVKVGANRRAARSTVAQARETIKGLKEQIASSGD